MRLRLISPIAALVAAVLLVAACGSPATDVGDVPELPTIDADTLFGELAASDRPVVVNVWASWCVPCRSEAPLLRQAAERFGDEVRFIGLDVRDSQAGARDFIAEFFPDAPIEHFFDPTGDVPVALGGTRGVPLTFFYAPGGVSVDLHYGAIDERTLALGIDEILRAP